MTMGGNTSSLQWNLQSKKTRNKKKLLKSIQKLSLKGGSFGSYRRALMVAVRRVWGSKRDRYCILRYADLNLLDKLIFNAELVMWK